MRQLRGGGGGGGKDVYLDSSLDGADVGPLVAAAVQVSEERTKRKDNQWGRRYQTLRWEAARPETRLLRSDGASRL